MTLETEQKAVILAVVRALLGVLPETWNAAHLRLERHSHEDGVTGCAHTITNPAGSRDFVEPSDELYEATRTLEELFERYSRPWKRAMMRVEASDDGKWDYTVDFEY